CKTHKSKLYNSLMKVRTNIKRIVCFTGTTSTNGLNDLWAEYRLLDMGERLGKLIGRFRESYFDPDKRNQHMIFSYKPKPGAEETIYEKISDITISMKGTDYLKIPNLVMNEMPVCLNQKEKESLDVMKRDLITKIKGEDITASNAAALSNKLLQMANGAVYDDNGSVTQIHDRKLEKLEDIIEAA